MQALIAQHGHLAVDGAVNYIRSDYTEQCEWATTAFKQYSALTRLSYDSTVLGSLVYAPGVSIAPFRT